MTQSRPSKGIVHLGLIIAIVVVVAAVAFGGWYVWQKNKNEPGDKATDTANSATQNDEKDTGRDPQTTDPYAGWKSYTSRTGKFAISYPVDWTLTVETSGSVDSNFSLEAPTAAYGNMLLTFGVSNIPTSYEVDTNVQTMANTLRAWTSKMQWTSEKYNDGRPFDCARLRLLDSKQSQDVTLATGGYLSSQGGFCMSEDSFTTKPYSEQLESKEMKEAVKIYESVRLEN